MDENKFFRSIWRVNGLAIFILMVFVLGIGGHNLVAEFFRADEPTVITNVAQDPEGEEKWSLGSTHEIDGTDYLYIPLVSEKKETSPLVPAMSSGLHKYASYFEPSRNILFVNKHTGAMKWLFATNRQLVSDIDLLSVLERHERDRQISAIMYKIIVRDTNGDKKLDSSDKVDVAFSLPDGRQYTQVIESVDRIFGTAMSKDEKEALILYQSEGRGYASAINLETMSIKQTIEMPKVENSP